MLDPLFTDKDFEEATNLSKALQKALEYNLTYVLG